MPFFVFAWIASFTSALVIIISKLTSRHKIANPWLFNFLWALVVLLIILPLAILNRASVPTFWLPVIVAGAGQALFYILYVLTIYKLDVSTITPLFNFRTVFAVLLGVLFLGESFTLQHTFLATLVVVAGVFATVDEKFTVKSFFNPAVGIALLAMLALAITNAATKWAANYNDVWTINLWLSIIWFAIITPTFPLFQKDLFKIKATQFWPIGVMGLLQSVTNFALTSALAVNVSVTAIIMSVPFSMILAVIFSIFAPTLLEKHSTRTYTIRFLAAAVMIYGAFQLSR